MLNHLFGVFATAAPTASAGETAPSAAISFFLNVSASLLASVLFVAGIYLFSRELRRVALWLYSRIVGIDIEAVFEDAAAAAGEIETQLRQSSELKLLAGRGNDLQTRPYSAALADRPVGRPIRISLLLPGRGAVAPDWIERRQEELAVIDPAYETPDLLRQQIDHSILFVRPYVERSIVELRHYDIPHIGRIAITDRYLFFTPYHKRKHGRESPVLQIRRRGVLAESYERLFDELWEHAM